MLIYQGVTPLAYLCTVLDLDHPHSMVQKRCVNALLNHGFWGVLNIMNMGKGFVHSLISEN